MQTTNRTAAAIGVDVHRRFSTVSARNAEGKIAWRQRLEHEDRNDLRKHLETWPRGTPVILESSFGWEWICEELEEAGLEPQLASSRKVAAWRNARGMAKSNRTDAKTDGSLVAGLAAAIRGARSPGVDALAVRLVRFTLPKRGL